MEFPVSRISDDGILLMAFLAEQDQYVVPGQGCPVMAWWYHSIVGLNTNSSVLFALIQTGPAN